MEGCKHRFLLVMLGIQGPVRLNICQNLHSRQTISEYIRPLYPFLHLIMRNFPLIHALLMVNRMGSSFYVRKVERTGAIFLACNYVCSIFDVVIIVIHRFLFAVTSRIIFFQNYIINEHFSDELQRSVRDDSWTRFVHARSL